MSIERDRVSNFPSYSSDISSLASRLAAPSFQFSQWSAWNCHFGRNVFLLIWNARRFSFLLNYSRYHEQWQKRCARRARGLHIDLDQWKEGLHYWTVFISLWSWLQVHRLCRWQAIYWAGVSALSSGFFRNRPTLREGYRFRPVFLGDFALATVPGVVIW